MEQKKSEKRDSVTALARKPRNSLHLTLGVILVAFGALTVITSLRSFTDNKQRLIAPKGIVTVELANTEDERRQGLMGRKELGDDAGMLFVFDDNTAGCFWMKDTPLPLDIVWLDADKIVMFVHENATPFSEERLCPKQDGAYVLEVKSGRAKALGLQPGAQVRF